MTMVDEPNVGRSCPLPEGIGYSSLAGIQEVREEVLAALCELLRAGGIRFGQASTRDDAP